MFGGESRGSDGDDTLEDDESTELLPVGGDSAGASRGAWVAVQKLQVLQKGGSRQKGHDGMPNFEVLDGHQLGGIVGRERAQLGGSVDLDGPLAADVDFKCFWRTSLGRIARGGGEVVFATHCLLGSRQAAGGFKGLLDGIDEVYAATAANEAAFVRRLLGQAASLLCAAVGAVDGGAGGRCSRVGCRCIHTSLSLGGGMYHMLAGSLKWKGESESVSTWR